VTIMFTALTQPNEWSWIRKKTNIHVMEDSQGIVAYQDGKIKACCVFDSIGQDSCNVHFAIDNPMVIRAGFFREIAEHVYITMGLKRMFGMVPSNNVKAYKLDKKIGFTEVALVPDGHSDGVDYHIMRMDKADCRWLADEYKEEAA
jgi:hypothetical protein